MHQRESYSHLVKLLGAARAVREHLNRIDEAATASFLEAIQRARQSAASTERFVQDLFAEVARDGRSFEEAVVQLSLGLEGDGEAPAAAGLALDPGDGGTEYQRVTNESGALFILRVVDGDVDGVHAVKASRARRARYPDPPYDQLTFEPLDQFPGMRWQSPPEPEAVEA